MSSAKFVLTALLIVFGSGSGLSAQDRNETKNVKSPCFNGRVEVQITHATPGNDNGSISLELPANAENASIFWVGPATTVKDRKRIEGLKPGTYTALIADRNNCTTRIDKITVKEVQ